MKLCKLRLQNFLAFREATIDLSTMRGLVLLSGRHEHAGHAESNGTGKSALIDGLLWSLYGQIARPRTRADDVVAAFAGRDCCVSLEFVERHGQRVEITRYRKHRKHKDALEISVDGKELTRPSTREMQAALDDLIGVDYQTFIGSVVYSQHPLRGRFAELGDVEKKALLDSILGLEAVADARERVKDDLREAGAKLERERSTIRSTEEQIAWLSDQLATCRRNADQWQEQHDGEERTLELRVKNLTDAVADHKYVEPKVMALPPDVDGAMRRVDQRLRETQSRMGAARALVGKFEAEVKSLDRLGAMCPTCGQEISCERKQDRRVALIAQIEEQQQYLAQCQDDDRDLLVEREEAQRALDQARQSQSEHKTWQQRLALLERDSAASTAQLEAHRGRTNQFAEMVADLEAKLAGKRDALEEAQQSAAASEIRLERLKFWEAGFGPRGLKSYFLDSVMPELNTRLREYSELLTGSAIVVRCSTVTERDEDKLTISVDGHGVESYALLSGGERQRVNLIMNLALQDLVASRAMVRIPLAIYDEAFEGLDGVGVRAAIELLKRAATTRDLVLVVTHQDPLRDLFDHEITVVNCDGESTIQAMR